MLPICSNCIYSRYPKIPPSRIKPAQLAIVGEAPGTTELAKKAPFVGPSGELLKKTLLKAGIRKGTSIFVTNAMLCKPPKGKVISKQAVELCRTRVLHEVMQVRPKVVLTLGATALLSLTGDSSLKITQQQGKAMYSKWLPDVIIVPCLHPAKILRTPGDYHNFLSAVTYAVSIVNGGMLKDPGKTTHQLVNNATQFEQFREYLRSLKESTHGTPLLVSCDIETTGLSPLRDKIVVVGISAEKNKTFIFPGEVEDIKINTDIELHNMLPYLKDVFEDTDLEFVWQGGKFDTGFFRNRGIGAEIDHDIMLQHYTQNENPPHDLDYLAVTILGAEAYKSKMDQYKKKGFHTAPWDTLLEYLAKDTDYTRQIHNILWEQVKSDPDSWKLYTKILIPGVRFLRTVEATGMMLDVPYTKQLESKLQAQKDELVKEIQQDVKRYWDPEQYKLDTGAKTAGQNLLPSSPKQLAWLFYDQMQILHGKDRTVDEAALLKIKDAHPVVPKLIQLRSVSKLLSTYIVGSLKRMDADGRVRSTYSLHTTVTGRLSSQNPNLQNIPGDPEIRGIFIAPPGKVLINADYKAAELRVLAHLSNDDFLMSCFIEGRDLHSEVATQLFGPNFTKEQRVQAKTVNFGIAYGRTEYSIAEAFKIPIQEARRMIEEWFKRAPKAAAYLLSCDEAARRGEVLTTPFGRKRRFGVVTPDNVEDLQHEARNFRIQSIASDLTFISAMEIANQIRRYKGTIVNLVHDSIVIEVPNDESTILQVGKICYDTMSQVPKRELNSVVPFEAELEIGTRWGNLDKVDITNGTIVFIKE